MSDTQSRRGLAGARDLLGQPDPVDLPAGTVAAAVPGVFAPSADLGPSPGGLLPMFVVDGIVVYGLPADISNPRRNICLDEWYEPRAVSLKEDIRGLLRNHLFCIPRMSDKPYEAIALEMFDEWYGRVNYFNFIRIACGKFDAIFEDTSREVNERWVVIHEGVLQTMSSPPVDCDEDALCYDNTVALLPTLLNPLHPLSSTAVPSEEVYQLLARRHEEFRSSFVVDEGPWIDRLDFPLVDAIFEYDRNQSSAEAIKNQRMNISALQAMNAQFLDVSCRLAHEIDRVRTQFSTQSAESAKLIRDLQSDNDLLRGRFDSLHSTFGAVGSSSSASAMAGWRSASPAPPMTRVDLGSVARRAPSPVVSLAALAAPAPVAVPPPTVPAMASTLGFTSTGSAVKFIPAAIKPITDITQAAALQAMRNQVEQARADGYSEVDLPRSRFYLPVLETAICAAFSMQGTEAYKAAQRANPRFHHSLPDKEWFEFFQINILGGLPATETKDYNALVKTLAKAFAKVDGKRLLNPFKSVGLIDFLNHLEVEANAELMLAQLPVKYHVNLVKEYCKAYKSSPWAPKNHAEDNVYALFDRMVTAAEDKFMGRDPSVPDKGTTWTDFVHHIGDEFNKINSAFKSLGLMTEYIEGMGQSSSAASSSKRTSEGSGPPNKRGKGTHGEVLLTPGSDNLHPCCGKRIGGYKHTPEQCDIYNEIGFNTDHATVAWSDSDVCKNLWKGKSSRVEQIPGPRGHLVPRDPEALKRIQERIDSRGGGKKRGAEDNGGGNSSGYGHKSHTPFAKKGGGGGSGKFPCCCSLNALCVAQPFGCDDPTKCVEQSDFSAVQAPDKNEPFDDSDLDSDNDLNDLHADDVNGHLTPATIHVRQVGVGQKGGKLAVFAAQVLLDSGALSRSRDFVSPEVANRIREAGGIVHKCRSRVCSPLGSCKECHGLVTFTLTLTDRIYVQNTVTFKVSAIVLEMPYPIILGRRTIRKYDLTRVLRSYFVETLPDQQASLNALTVLQGGEVPFSECLDASRPVYSKEELLGPMIDDDDETGDLPDIGSYLPAAGSLSASTAAAAGVNDDDLPPMRGVTPFHFEIRDLCREFSDIFSRTVKETPADCSPMELKVDLAKWQVSSNRQSPRVQAPLRRAEIRRQVALMLQLGVIRPSRAQYYSQVLLTNKKEPGKFRFCIDYRALNEASSFTSGFPLPNIDAILAEIGEKKAVWFGVMDGTSGFHQMCLALHCCHFGAFITQDGLFEPLRVMFGMKSAPSFFQEVFCNEVLTDLLIEICRLYIDDILLWGRDEKDFLANLRRLFVRLRSKGITLNPDKVKLGELKTEFLGHIIDRYGTSMSPERKLKVVDFVTPATVKDMQSFLGLANYFRSFVKRLSWKMAALQPLIVGKKGRTPIVWTEDARREFEGLKQDIAECPSLRFLNDQDPIYLYTDASDYGIGGYLYQVVSGVHYPVGFYSKSLNKTQCNWSTYEKECFAIFKSLERFRFLLRDRKFSLHTDHRNLTYMGREGSSQKVVRWKLAIQEYNFDIHHVSGPLNFVADGFSRLIARLDRGDRNAIVEYEGPDEETVVDENDVVALNVIGDVEISPAIMTALKAVHNDIVGHFGVDRTLERLREAGHKVRYLHEMVRIFVRDCPICQKLSYRRPIYVTRPFTTARYAPMLRLNVDAIGPFPKSNREWRLRKDNPDGYEYVLVIVDCFTRFVHLIPIYDTSSAEGARGLLIHIGLFGAPVELLSDRGPQFANGLIAELLRMVGTQHILSLAYSKEENAIVERTNLEFLRVLRAILYSRRIWPEWDLCLPLVSRILNAKKHSSTQHSPAQMLFGQSIDLDQGFLHGVTEDNTPPLVTLNEWVRTRNLLQQEIFRVARTAQDALDLEHREERAGGPPTTYPIDSFVLVMYPRSTIADRRPTNKFQSFWRGPLRVVNYIGDEYSLQDLNTLQVSQHHVGDLKRFHYDPAHTDPRRVAQGDSEQTDIERIVAHLAPADENERHMKSKYQFLVKWQDHSDEFNLWLDWKHVASTDQLARYLVANGLAKFISERARRERFVLEHNAQEAAA